MELDGLLAGVLADPDADLPRLVLADWLDERGRPGDAARAEFIRAQVELAGVPPHTPPTDPRVLGLRVREKVLLAAHGAAWLAPLRAPGGPLPAAAHGLFRRGFVEVVWMPAGAFAGRAADLFARAPVRELRVTRATRDEMAAVIGRPEFGRLTGLDVSGSDVGPRVALLLQTNPGAAAGLRRLRLRACGLGHVAAARLLAARFGRLDELDLGLNPNIPAADLAALRARFGAAVVFDGG